MWGVLWHTTGAYMAQGTGVDQQKPRTVSLLTAVQPRVGGKPLSNAPPPLCLGPVLHSPHQMWWAAPSNLRGLGKELVWSITGACVGGPLRGRGSTCEQRDNRPTLTC